MTQEGKLFVIKSILQVLPLKIWEVSFLLHTWRSLNQTLTYLNVEAWLDLYLIGWCLCRTEFRKDLSNISAENLLGEVGSFP